jgi:hypothetical protein
MAHPKTRRQSDTNWPASYTAVTTTNHAVSERLFCPQKERCRRSGSSYFWLVFWRSRVQTSVRKLLFLKIYGKILGYYFQLGHDRFMTVLSNSSLAIRANNRRYIQGGSNMTGTYAACLHRNQSRSYLNHLVYLVCITSTLSPKHKIV